MIGNISQGQNNFYILFTVICPGLSYNKRPLYDEILFPIIPGH